MRWITFLHLHATKTLMLSEHYGSWHLRFPEIGTYGFDQRKQIQGPTIGAYFAKPW